MFNMFTNIISDSNADLKKTLEADPYLVDVRTPEEFTAGSVKGAVNIPVDKIPDNLGAFEDKNNIIVFCRTGVRSAEAKRFLEQKGCKNVLNGGRWQDIGELINDL